MRNLLFILLFSTLSLISHGSITVTAHSLYTYQSVENNPNENGYGYDSIFYVGSYSKDYAMVTLLYFDLNQIDRSPISNSVIEIGLYLESIIGNPNNMNIDYLGSFTDMPQNYQQEIDRRYAPALTSFLNVLTSASENGTISIPLTGLSEQDLNEGYVAFRLYQTDYLIGDSQTNEYHFSPNLSDITLSFTQIPESKTIAFGLAAICIAFISFRRFSARTTQN